MEEQWEGTQLFVFERMLWILQVGRCVAAVLSVDHPPSAGFCCLAARPWRLERQEPWTSVLVFLKQTLFPTTFTLVYQLTTVSCGPG